MRENREHQSRTQGVDLSRLTYTRYEEATAEIQEQIINAVMRTSKLYGRPDDRNPLGSDGPKLVTAMVKDAERIVTWMEDATSDYGPSSHRREYRHWFSIHEGREVETVMEMVAKFVEMPPADLRDKHLLHQWDTLGAVVKEVELEMGSFRYMTRAEIRQRKGVGYLGSSDRIEFVRG